MQKQLGFTLLELIIVIILMGILSAGVYIEWPGTTINLYAEAQRLANNIRYTQALSMTKGQRYRLVKTSATAYQITNASGSPLALAQGNTIIALSSGITFGTLTNLPNSLIVFNGKGIPYIDTGSPGTALSSTATFTLTASGETRTVSIVPETGRTIVQ